MNESNPAYLFHENRRWKKRDIPISQPVLTELSWLNNELHNSSPFDDDGTQLMSTSSLISLLVYHGGERLKEIYCGDVKAHKDDIEQILSDQKRNYQICDFLAGASYCDENRLEPVYSRNSLAERYRNKHTHGIIEALDDIDDSPIDTSETTFATDG